VDCSVACIHGELHKLCGLQIVTIQQLRCSGLEHQVLPGGWSMGECVTSEDCMPEVIDGDTHADVHLSSIKYIS